MIRIHADAVLHVKDGFSGLPVSTAGLLCRLDGAPCQPVRKQNGELVLIDLPEGPHCVTIECFGFQKEQLDLVTSPNVTQEVYVTLKPSENYPFRGDVTRLFLTVKEGQKAAPGRAVWLTAIGAPECKIAQTKAEAGAMEVRLFWKGPASRLGVPGQFLIDDGEDAEIVTVQRLKGENGVLAAPLKKPHGRGKLLLPAQQFRADVGGTVSAAFRAAGTVLWHCERTGKSGRIDLSPGENRLTLSLQAQGG